MGNSDQGRAEDEIERLARNLSPEAVGPGERGF